jgi:hypothetical protein
MNRRIASRYDRKLQNRESQTTCSDCRSHQQSHLSKIAKFFLPCPDHHLTHQRAREQQRKLGAQAPPQTSPGPRCEPHPSTHDPHPTMFPAKARHACNSRLSPPGKRRVHPHWAPKTAPRRWGQFPTWPPPEGRGTAPSPDQTRRGRLTPTALSQMGVIRPVRSPHPGSQTSRECMIAQKAAFVCTNLVRVGTVSNTVSGGPGASSTGTSAEHGTSFPRYHAQHGTDSGYPH